MRIRLLESARDDLRDAWYFYEKQSPGLGDYFLDSIQADVRSLTIYGGIHAFAEGYQRLLAKRFPFAIYYLIEQDAINVYAILDCRRDPEWIVKRLENVRPQE